MKFIICLLLSSSLLSAEEKRPNILFLLSDDQAWGDYGFMGHPHIETPAIDKLAKSGLTFKRGYNPVPLCRPSLASILTGLHPHQHGVTGNDPQLSDDSKTTWEARKDPELSPLFTSITKEWRSHPNWVRSLKESGYRTLQTGKWWEGNPVTEGDFTEGMTSGNPNEEGRHGDKGLEIGRKGLAPIKNFISESGDEPWFVWYGVFLPHSPHNPPQELLDKYLTKTDNPNIAAYWACCEWLDNTIAELMAYLEESGELENTLIVYTCDNGWIQDADRANRFAPRSKRTAYEGGVRTPIIFSWKNQILPRIDSENLASNLDIWPTAAALCKTPLPDGLPGINLTDFAAVEDREAIFGASYLHDIIEHGKPEKSLTHRFVVDGNWKLIAPNPLTSEEENPQPELYDLAKDPAESSNLAPDQPKRVAELFKKLNRWWKPSN